MVSSKICKPKCDIRKMNRRPAGDDRVKDEAGRLIIEYLGFSCKRCNARWKQKIMYQELNDRKKILWIKDG